MYVYDTVTEAVKGLKERGYTKDFNLRENYIVCDEDEAVVYAIESNKGNRGVLVNGYGISADEMTAEMARKLSMHRV
jgi:hypothetical protein